MVQMFSFSTFLFCKYAFSIKNYLIKGSALNCRQISLKHLVASLNRFLLVEIPGTQKYTYLMILVFIFKCENADDKKDTSI